jgi:acetylornithine deacetylase/succinyl-diaminopimelate desuccinylase-like protein
VADGALVDLAAALVGIDSINPDLIAGAAGEQEAAAFAARWLERGGLDVKLVEPRAGRPSVIAVARGRGGGRTLLLNGHLDTVGVAGMDAPFEPRVEGDRLYGRGAYDMKAAVAAAMVAASEAARLGLRGDVIVTAVADEELSSLGTSAVLEHVSADAAIVCEPTELRVAVAHRGFAGFEVETHGRAAHGSRPDLGVDAIAKMGRVLVELEALDTRVQSGRRHALLGPGSLHASLIEGGQEFSSYPARCVVTGERRTIPGETPADVERELRDALERARRADPALEAAVRMLVSREPFEIDQAHELVATVSSAAGETEVVGLPFWADSGLIAAAGIPTVLFGPRGEGAHAVVEWVDLPAVERCRDVYLEVAKAVCG